MLLKKILVSGYQRVGRYTKRAIIHVYLRVLVNVQDEVETATNILLLKLFGTKKNNFSRK